MTYIVSGGALNSTHSLTCEKISQIGSATIRQRWAIAKYQRCF